MKFWANFCTLPREKIFALFCAKKGLRRPLFARKFFAARGQNFRAKAREKGPPRGENFSRARGRGRAAKNPGAATAFARFAREIKLNEIKLKN